MAIKNDAEKKKMLILGVLVAVICGVGAFQFIGGSSQPAPAAKKEKKESGESGPIKNDIDKARSVAANGNAATANTNSAMPGSNSTAQVTDVKDQVPTEISEDSPLRKLYAMKLPVRDPFADTTNPKIEQPVQQPQQTTPPPRQSSRPPRMQGNLVQPMNPGNLIPNLPGAEGNNGAGGQPVLRLEGEFSYHMTGMIDGARPAVVFSDDQGNQKLVPVGGAIDGDSRVVSAGKGKVVVSHKGKKITLTMGGQPNAK